MLEDTYFTDGPIADWRNQNKNKPANKQTYIPQKKHEIKVALKLLI